MEQENTNQVEQRSGSPETSATQADSGYDVAVRQVNKPTATPQNPAYEWAEPITAVLRELLDLPRQILPEQTYMHMRNAGKEAMLAVVSLVNSLNDSAKGPESGKTRKHIDVE